MNVPMLLQYAILWNSYVNLHLQEKKYVICLTKKSCLISLVQILMNYQEYYPTGIYSYTPPPEALAEKFIHKSYFIKFCKHLALNDTILVTLFSVI